MTPPTISTSGESPASQWNYVKLEVLDADRVLRPTHCSFDFLIFKDPPKVTSDIIQVIVTNRGIPHSRYARVLPHDETATRIPIELIVEEEETTPKLTS
jgi:hypothetical protein